MVFGLAAENEGGGRNGMVFGLAGENWGGVGCGGSGEGRVMRAERGREMRSLKGRSARRF